MLTAIAHSYRRTYMPLSYHIAQEVQKYNIPDYRPRQEQCVHVSHIHVVCIRVLTRIHLSFPPLIADSRRRSRRSARCSVCGATVGLRSARRKTRRDRSKPGSSARTIRLRVRGRRGIDWLICPSDFICAPSLRPSRQFRSSRLRLQVVRLCY